MADYQFVSNDKMTSPDIENQNIKMACIEEFIPWKEVESFLNINDHEGLAKLIKDKGIQVVWRPSDAPGKITPLHKAAEIGSISCMKVLTEACWSNGISIDSPDCDGNTPLFYAVKATNIESINELLSVNAHVNARNDQGHSILHALAYAISGSKEKDKQDKLLECLELILNRPDIDLEAHNNSGFTPLLSAAKKMPSDDGTRRSNNLILFCRRLSSKGASLDASDKRGISARQTLEERSALTAVLMGERRPPPQRPFPSLLLDTLILGGDDEQISELLSGQPQEEANRASNMYIGSQSVLFYVVDKCNPRAVEALLEAGADSWKEQLSGELCLHRALSRGYFNVLNMLINNMKKKKNVRQLDLTHQSFELLERLLENQTKKPIVNAEVDHLKCLQRILEYDIKINVNEQSDRGVTQSILHVAACFNNQEAIRLLLENGAFLGARKNVVGEDRGNILSALKPDTLERAMDGCITYQRSPDDIDENHSENLISPDYTLKLNYKFLVPPTDNQDETEHQNEVQTLMNISVHRAHRKAIKHPLIQTFLFAKWRKVLPLYIVNLSLYLGFVIFLTFFMYTLKDLRISEEKLVQINASNQTIEKDIESRSTTLRILMAFLIPLTLYMLLREAFQIIYTFRTYLKNFENYLEWFLITIVIILCTATLSVDLTRHLAAWAMIIAWYEFVLLLGRSPPLAIYVTMLRHVSWNFLKLIFLYGALILAFSVSFNIILQPTSISQTETDFGNFWSTLPKSIVMATGEFEYSDLSSSFLTSRVIFATSAVLIFLVFLFLIFLVLMNVMNGLAVTDTQQVMEEATLYSLKSRLELIYLIEEMLLVTPFFNRFLAKIHLISPPKNNSHLLTKLNYPEKKKRIVYGGSNQQFCKLDNDTAHVLRSYRLQLISEKEEREKLNPVHECLNLLQELRELASQNPRGLLSPATLSPSSSRARLS